jgi:hypothetical protein
MTGCYHHSFGRTHHQILATIKGLEVEAPRKVMRPEKGRRDLIGLIAVSQPALWGTGDQYGITRPQTEPLCPCMLSEICRSDRLTSRQSAYPMRQWR